MNCPECEGRTEVLETRKYKLYPKWNYRLRQCLTCNTKVKTLEMTLEDFQNALTSDNDNVIEYDESG